MARRRSTSAWRRARSASGRTEDACRPSTRPEVTDGTGAATSTQFLERGGASLPRRSEGGRRLILIVDDDERLREFIRVNLEMEGYAVREAGSAEEGLEVLEEEPPDLILLDVMMPKVDGWEMLRRVHERHGVGSIPVIMFSGKVEEESLKTATARGAQGFIGKPFNPQQLIESTKQLVPA